MNDDYPREIIIAVTDKTVSSALCDLIQASFPSLHLAARADNSADAMKAVFSSEFPPVRLIFADSVILGENPNFLHHLLRLSAASACLYVALEPDFFALQNALRCGVNDCLLYPFSQQTLSDTLARLQRQRELTDRRVPSEANEASRYLFWRTDVRKLASTHMSMAQVNKEYGTHFSEGLFRALFIELSSPGHENDVVDNTELQDIIIRSSSQIMQPETFDVLYNRHANGISVLLNYSVGKRGLISRLIDRLFFSLRQEFASRKIEVTMSIGRIYSEFSKLAEVKQEILDVRWARHRIGSGGIISADVLNENELLPEKRRELEELRALILHYFELLDQKRAKQYIDKFYDNFASVLPIREIRTFSRFLLDFLFQTYAADLEPYGAPENLRHSYIARESTATTVETLRKITTDSLLDLMEKIELVVRRQYSRPVRDCIALIASRHCSGVCLTDLAEMTHLSPQYLSTLFHKETGQTISAYIQAQKLKLAQNLLANSTKNIAEIAAYLNFSDAHYFSNFFKKHMSITPTAYRNIKRNK